MPDIEERKTEAATKAPSYAGPDEPLTGTFGVVDEKASIDLVNDENSSLLQGKVVERPEDVAFEIISAQDDPSLPVLTFRAIFIGIGLSAFSSVLSTIYTFKPQSVGVSGSFCLIIAYVLGTAMAVVIPTHGYFRWFNPGPFNVKEHTFILIMSSTASIVAAGMEIVAALDLYYYLRLNTAVALFQIFATQMLGYGVAGLLRNFLVYPSYAFYPNAVAIVSLLQSLHFQGALNAKRRKFFWFVFAAIFFWEWIPQYPFPLLTAVSIVCLVDNGRHEFVRNLFGGGSNNEGLGLLSFTTSWTLMMQGSPLVWPLQTQINSYIGVALGYIILMACYYSNVFNGRDLPFMSTSLFGRDGQRYNQSAVIGADFKLNQEAIESVGLPRFTTTYAISKLFYNISLGATITYILLWHWNDLRAAFGSMRFLRRAPADVDDPHYQEMRKYPEVPQWIYVSLFIGCLAIAIGCNYSASGGMALVPGWSIVFFTVLNIIMATIQGFVIATTGSHVLVTPAVQIISAFLHPGQPIPMMYASLFASSSSFQTMFMLQDLKVGQYVKLPPRMTLLAQLSGSMIGSIFNYSMMKMVVANNREVLKSPLGTRVWSGRAIQQYNSVAVAMGALGRELFTFGKPYWVIPFGMFIGLFVPLPFWVVWKFSKKGSLLSRVMGYIHIPLVTISIAHLPLSVNGQGWSCAVIGFISQWWLRRHRPSWFIKYNYLMSAALDCGAQVIMFILAFAVFGAGGKAVEFPFWWGNPESLSVDRCMAP